MLNIFTTPGKKCTDMYLFSTGKVILRETRTSLQEGSRFQSRLMRLGVSLNQSFFTAEKLSTPVRGRILLPDMYMVLYGRSMRS